MTYTVAGIDVHKKVLMAVVVSFDAEKRECHPQRRRFGTTTSELQRLAQWLQQQGVEKAEVGPRASAFASAARLTSWAGTCPGQEESADENRSSRSPKGNKYLRRVLTEAAQAAVKTKGSHFQVVFRRLLPRLGYKQALWAVVHRLCRVVWKILHDGVRFIGRGAGRVPKARRQRAAALA